ncbi:DoxX family protein [Flagellimonas halotolerans]|uniref:DoxX family protein n=1 Tax=Flagellimonas halotolerans TaxID=3112164 RepID=A0ABU6IRD9_9FLAO|nr:MULTISPECIES: DoxX family protein [unclassified Allomuricauda]MEC3965847.1 DoxX family protein [Muricauda sp. SYSU M86414]MEC4265687.1 DoxX family protein [Muricauda sp. SYSU M84420]
MKNSNKIMYWVVTIFLSIGMSAGGIQQLFQVGGYNEIVTELGYPLYLLSILGAWKLLGVIAILLPKFPLLKEWAYAGFFFAMSGAFISHLAAGQPFSEAIPSLLLMVVTVLSWYLRPMSRKITIITSRNEQ